MYITDRANRIDLQRGGCMYLKIDFNSYEAFYIQLRNQIIYGIATSKIQEGDNLPSVRVMADYIGINMHTVNKAYSILKQEGYLKIDRRKGNVIAIDCNKYEAMRELKESLKTILAEAHCKNVNCEEVIDIVKQIYSEFERG